MNVHDTNRQPRAPDGLWPFFPFPEQDWKTSPAPVQACTLSIGILKERVVQNTGNSDQPPSSDKPFIDETSRFLNGVLVWLWVMVNANVAITALIENWIGVFISDGYAVYQKWVTPCLAHLIRTGEGLAERADPEIAACGKWAVQELKRLCQMARAPPTEDERRAFYARLCKLINKYHERKDDAGKFARRLLREVDSLWVFLEYEDVEPTNNRAERALRFGVLWRKYSQGTSSEKGNRWVERILSCPDLE